MLLSCGSFWKMMTFFPRVVHLLISPSILSVIGNTAKDLDVTKVSKRLRLFDKNGMAEQLGNDKE